MDFQVDDAFIVPPSNANAGNPDDSGVRDYADTSHALGARFAINEHWALSASYGRGFETPTLTEMAYKSQGTGLNTDLDAATNQQYEMGIHYKNTWAEFNTNVFVIDTNNELVVDQSLNGRTSYTNATATRRDGFELFGRLHFTGQWQLQTSATLIDATYAKGELDNHRLPGVAREQYQLDLQYLPFSNEHLVFSVGIHKRTAIATSDSNEFFAPGFYRFDVAIEGKAQPVKFDLDWWLKLANLTDENYVGSVIVNQSNGRAFEPAPGRSILGGIGIRY
jgi:iron complex outermembrane receptor protein